MTVLYSVIGNTLLRACEQSGLQLRGRQMLYFVKDHIF